MHSQGFEVTPHYLGLETAWRAQFSLGEGGRTIGVNSEMDALPNIGHGCGHNLIAIAGVGVAIALKRALEAHNVTGTVILLGTPGMSSLEVCHATLVSQKLCSRGRRRWQRDLAAAWSVSENGCLCNVSCSAIVPCMSIVPFNCML